MEINNQAFSSHVRESAQSDDKKAIEPMEHEISAMAHAKKQLNSAILASAVQVNVNAGNDSLSLVLKAALEGINEALKEVTGEDNTIQAVYDSGLDVGPEATADRIVSLSTAFFGAFQERHPEMDFEEALSSFVDIIGSGIDTGFKEARDILTGLNVLEGDIASNIDKTYELVQQGLKSFVESFNEPEE